MAVSDDTNQTIRVTLEQLLGGDTDRRSAMLAAAMETALGEMPSVPVIYTTAAMAVAVTTCLCAFSAQFQEEVGVDGRIALEQLINIFNIVWRECGATALDNFQEGYETMTAAKKKVLQ